VLFGIFGIFGIFSILFLAAVYKMIRLRNMVKSFPFMSYSANAVTSFLTAFQHGNPWKSQYGFWAVFYYKYFFYCLFLATLLLSWINVTGTSSLLSEKIRLFFRRYIIFLAFLLVIPFTIVVVCYEVRFQGSKVLDEVGWIIIFISVLFGILLFFYCGIRVLIILKTGLSSER